MKSCSSIVLWVSLLIGNAICIHYEPKHESPLRLLDNQVDDIVLTDAQKNAIKNGDVITASSPYSYAVHKDLKRRWPNAIIPYQIDCSLEFMESALTAIQKAIDVWESKTCIRFVKKTTEQNFVTFFRGSHCYTQVGMIGGENRLSVGPDCDLQHIMEHEIGHIIGFFHEHNRPDRDQYIDVQWENIANATIHAFEIVKDADTLGSPYDYGSIMHYYFTAFSINGKNTTVPKKPVHGEPYTTVSARDAWQANVMYNCHLPGMRNRGRRSSLKDPKACVDKDVGCAEWARLGYCKRGGYTTINCEISCNATHCLLPGATALPPQPTTPPTPPPPTKRTFTGRLPTDSNGGIRIGHGILCVDNDVRCKELASYGECTNNPGYMMAECKFTCNATDCDHGVQKPQGYCSEPLGLSWDGKQSKLPDTSFTASSFDWIAGNWSAKPSNARLYLADDRTTMNIGAWCIGSWEDFDKGGYVQVDLGRYRRVRYIATQGRYGVYERVSKFKITYSYDGQHFHQYEEQGKSKIFNGNCDHFTPILNEFTPIVNARYIRLHPTEANYACLRMEFYGC